MGLQDIAFQLERDAYQQVKADTWGHLAPEKGKTYPVFMIVAVGYFSEDCLNPMLLTCQPEDGPWHGPWFYDSVRDFIAERVGKDENSGKLFSFAGHWRNYRFVGTFKELRLEVQGRLPVIAPGSELRKGRGAPMRPLGSTPGLDAAVVAAGAAVVVGEGDGAVAAGAGGLGAVAVGGSLVDARALDPGAVGGAVVGAEPAGGRLGAGAGGRREQQGGEQREQGKGTHVRRVAQDDGSAGDLFGTRGRGGSVLGEGIYAGFDDGGRTRLGNTPEINDEAEDAA